MRARLLAAILAALSVGLPGSASAQTPDPQLWGIGLGIFDVQDKGFQSLNLNVEWRGQNLIWTVKPMVGVALNTDGAVYGYGGIALDLNLTDSIVVTPTFAPTLYLKGDSKDLGSWFEFRSGIELAYRFDDRSRLGLALHHLSHAGLGGDDNPGTETLTLYYFLPLSNPLGH